MWPFTCGPRPSTKRPFDIACRSHAIIAVAVGLRGNAIKTAVVSRARSVLVAASSSGAHGSFFVSPLAMPS